MSMIVLIYRKKLMLSDAKKPNALTSVIKELSGLYYLVLYGFCLSAIYYLYAIGSRAQFPHAMDFFILATGIGNLVFVFDNDRSHCRSRDRRGPVCRLVCDKLREISGYLLSGHTY